MIRCVPLVLLAACQRSASGTFIGNPTLGARLTDNAVQRAAGGRLEALEIHFTDTNDADTQLGPRTFLFDGADAAETIQVPTGEFGGIFLVVASFEVRFEEDGQATTVTSDADLTLPAPFAIDPGADYVLRLGDLLWLEEVAALVAPGPDPVDVATDPELEAAFIGGIERGSEVTRADP